MNLATYVETLRDQLVAAAESGGPESRAAVERLVPGLEAAMRLVLLEALSAAADEITRELAPGVGGGPPARQRPRLRRDPAGLRGRRRRHVRAAPPRPTVIPAGDDEGGTSRLNLRLPEGLKARIEEAARREGLSLNAWLVRAAAAAVEGTHAQTPRRSPGRQPAIHRMGPLTTPRLSTKRTRSAHADVRDQPADRPVDRDEPGCGARHRH